MEPDPFSGVQWQDQKQQTETERGNSKKTLAQVAWKGCGVSILRIVQNSIGHRPRQPALADPA